jgi:hypothetical protein
MAGGDPRLGMTATYMRHNDHRATHISTKIDRLHDLTDNEYRLFSEGSVRKWSKFGLAIIGLVIWDLAWPEPLLVQGEAQSTRIDRAARVSGRLAKISVARDQDVRPDFSGLIGFGMSYN